MASLGDDARRGWDLCILTASDERQAEMVRRQLAWRREAHLLPSGTEFVVLPDPGGRRVGSGGATLRALELRTEKHPYPAGRRTLIIHSGGESKRLPHCSAQGKLFARIPRTLPDGRASTIFDEFLITLSGLAPVLPPGALVASGDVLLVFDHLQLAFRRPGAIGVAAAAPAEMGLRHGVFVTDRGDGGRVPVAAAPEMAGAAEGRGHHVRAYLHKPGPAELERWAAVQDGQVQIDTGLVWLDGGMLERLAVVGSHPAVTAAPLNLYGDLLLPLAASTGFEGYVKDTSDGPATPPVKAARRVVWDLLRGAPFTVEQLRPAVFVHFGSSAEYWRMAAADEPLARLCGWENRTAAWQERACSTGLPVEDPECLVLINAAVEGEVRNASQDAGFEASERGQEGVGPERGRQWPLLVCDSRLTGPLTWHGAGLISGVRTAQALNLAPDLVLDQLPLGPSEVVTRCFGLRDDPKRPFDHPMATFCNVPWTDWLQAADVMPEDLWQGIPTGQRTLWNARLFPALADRDESLQLALALPQVCAPAGEAPSPTPFTSSGTPPDTWRKRWLATRRVSLSESAALVDGDRLLEQLVAIEDYVTARRFNAAILEEMPAAEAKPLLGALPESRARRASLCDAGLANFDALAKLRIYRGLAEATGETAWEDRAFSLLAELIGQATLSARRTRNAAPSRRQRAGEVLQVAGAARIDLGGGWTDTPPHSIERGGTVLNAAIALNGAHPITAEVCCLEEPRLILQSRDLDIAVEPRFAGDVLAYANPTDPFALPKAALVLRGLVPADADPNQPLADIFSKTGGLRLTTGAAIPMGSGLGTSSILAGTVLVALSELTGEGQLPAGQLFDEVLCLEQMLTTGGGWQDQVGGLTGGIKLVTSRPGLPQQITVAPVRLDARTESELAARLRLVYTGQQRLAKNLLRNIMSRWMAREPQLVWIQGEIARLALAMRERLLMGDIDQFGELLGEHWKLNKAMDPGCTNPFIDDLFEAMKPFINGGKLAGAGGGGFASVVARSPEHARGLAEALAERYPGTRVGLWPSSIPPEGIQTGSM